MNIALILYSYEIQQRPRYRAMEYNSSSTRNAVAMQIRGSYVFISLPVPLSLSLSFFLSLPLLLALFLTDAKVNGKHIISSVAINHISQAHRVSLCSSVIISISLSYFDFIFISCPVCVYFFSINTMWYLNNYCTRFVGLLKRSGGPQNTQQQITFSFSFFFSFARCD